jgi:ribosomal protein L32
LKIILAQLKRLRKTPKKKKNNMAKFCSNCGQALEPGAKFCPNCGTATAKEETNPPQEEWQVVVGDNFPTPPPIEQFKPKKPKKNKPQAQEQAEEEEEESQTVQPNDSPQPSLKGLVFSQSLAHIGGILFQPGAMENPATMAMFSTAIVNLLASFVAGNKPGAARKTVLLCSVILAIWQGGSLFSNVLRLFDDPGMWQYLQGELGTQGFGFVTAFITAMKARLR